MTPFDWLIGGPSQLVPGGVYEAAFQSGSIQIQGPNGTLEGFGDFQFGLALPNASGILSEGMLIGGAGKTQAVIITDEQLPGQKGITLIIEAGDASPFGAANDDGGDLLEFAGGTLNGNGGTAKWQGGTSVHARAGDAVLQGGDTTDGTPGNAVCIGGVTGPLGADVHLIMTKPPGASTWGVVRIMANSTPLYDFFHDGSVYIYNGGGFGTPGQKFTTQGPGLPVVWS
jgi:hypothetical protein